MYSYPPPLERLIKELRKLPGLGPKSAERIALSLIERPPEETQALIESLKESKEKVQYCSQCYNFSEGERCSICSDPKREKDLLCVVESPPHVVALEKAGGFKGLYHVLLGAISPLEGMGPEDIKLKELLQRVREGVIKEVILATDGEETTLYLAKVLKPLGVKVTRIARGIPVGSSLNYMDERTVKKALEGRSVI